MTLDEPERVFEATHMTKLRPKVYGAKNKLSTSSRAIHIIAVQVSNAVELLKQLQEVASHRPAEHNSKVSPWDPRITEAPVKHVVLKNHISLDVASVLEAQLPDRLSVVLDNMNALAMWVSALQAPYDPQPCTWVC